MSAVDPSVREAIRLWLADGLALPAEMVTEKLAAFGISKYGKTYTLGKLAELFLELGAQVVLIDTVGKLYGLKASADGKAAGYPLVVFGGAHADVPVTKDGGAAVARAIVERRLSAIVDVSEFEAEDLWLFMRGFFREFFQAKKRHPSAVHLFFEECQEIFPEAVEGREQRQMRSAGLTLLKIGRNYGVGWTLASQEPQAVSIRARSQIGTLIAHRTRNDFAQRWLFSWAQGRVSDAELLEFKRHIRDLDVGEAYFLSGDMNVARRIKVLPKTTFNSSRTPQVGESLAPPRVLAPVEVADLRARLAKMVEEAEADDPEALRRRVAALEGELRAERAKRTPPAAPPKPAVPPGLVELARTVPGLVDAAARLFEPVRAKLDEATRAGLKMVDLLEAAEEQARAGAGAVTVGMKGSPPPPEGEDLLPGARAILGALRSAGKALSREDALVRAVLSPRSGSTSNRLAELRARALVRDAQGLLALTAEGAAAAGPVPAEGAELLEAWKAKLDQPTSQRMLDALARSPRGLTRDELCDEVAASRVSGSTSNRLAELRGLNLAQDSDGRIYAHPALLPDGRRP